MELRDITVVLDGSAQSEIRLTVALGLAQKHEAFLAGTCALDMLRAGGHQDPEAGVAEIAERIEADFRSRIRFGGVQGDWLTTGKLNQSFVRHARQTDLIILGQAQPDSPLSASGRHLVEDFLLASGRPILIIPYAGRFDTIGTSVLVGWNDSREAVRAVNDAMPVLSKAASVTILEAHPPKRQSDAGDTSADIARHLARHGIKADTTHTVMSGISASDTLLASAADLGADLLVVGGYGHSRLWESILGGATRGLLQHMTVPVLMSH